MTFKRIFCVLAFALPLSLWAQEGVMFSFMRLNPFKLYTSPAAELPYKGYLAMPAIGDVNVGIYNSSIRYNKMFKTENGYPTTLSLNDLVNSLGNNNYLNTDADISLLSFGFRKKNTFFVFDYRIRMNQSLHYSKDLLALPVLGNLSYLGADSPADMKLYLNLSAYQEIGVGVQHTINKHFAFGVRCKYLSGLLNVNNARLDAQLYTDEDTYAMQLFYSAEAKMSCILPYELSFGNGVSSFSLDMDDFDFKRVANYFQNHGFGVDAGFSYKINDRFLLSLSFLDMGLIYWKSNCNSIQSEPVDNGRFYQDGAVAFSGLSQSDITALSQNEESRQLFLDTLSAYFPLNINAVDGYVSSLATRGILQFDYSINKYNRLSALVQARFIRNCCVPSMTLAYEGCFGNCINLCAAYTIAPRSYMNVGLGLGLKLGVFNLYFSTENIIPAFKFTNFSRWTFRFGIAFNWGDYK